MNGSLDAWILCFQAAEIQDFLVSGGRLVGSLPKSVNFLGLMDLDCVYIYIYYMILYDSDMMV